MQRFQPGTIKKQAWQTILADLITDPAELFALLNLDSALLEAAITATRLFPLKMPRGVISRIQAGDINDPILKQFLPLGAELAKVAGYVSDPLQEDAKNPIPGLLHKYHGRVLVTLTSACAVHCRYCFRRHFPYQDNNPGRVGWEKIAAYIRADESIQEVILSGGDPLSVTDHLLAAFTMQLMDIAHLRWLRVHTRLPIMIPERITDELIAWIKQMPWQFVMVVHVNHPREIDASVNAALLRLQQAGIRVLNQAVLLKGVNDDVATLKLLSETLYAAGVLPYYLHVLDKVQSAAHFDLPLAEAQALHASLANQLPGYLVPRLMREEAGAGAKTVVSSYL